MCELFGSIGFKGMYRWLGKYAFTKARYSSIDELQYLEIAIEIRTSHII